MSETFSKVKTRIVAIDRGVNTKSGNPHYTVVTVDGSFDTEMDGAINYGITNAEFKNVDVILTLRADERGDRKGTIVGIKTATGGHCAGMTQP